MSQMSGLDLPKPQGLSEFQSPWGLTLSPDQGSREAGPGKENTKDLIHFGHTNSGRLINLSINPVFTKRL